MSGPRPNPLARCLVGSAVQMLPRDRRERYREEFRTELCELDGAGQVAAAASLLRGSLALRQAVVSREVAAKAAPQQSMSCRLGRHRYVGQRDVDLASEYHLSYRCERCGSYFERTPDEEEGFDIDTLRRNANYFSGGAM